MATFQLFGDKRRLKNAQHFAFIQAFITAIQQSGMTAHRPPPAAAAPAAAPTQAIPELALTPALALAVQAQTQEAQVPTPAAATPKNKPINNKQITNKKNKQNEKNYIINGSVAPQRNGSECENENHNTVGRYIFC